MKRIAIIVIGVTLIFGAAAAGTAYDYPTRPIQVVCPFPPGGPVDLAIRIVNDGMTEYLGQQVITVNKPGGAITVAWTYVVGSKPDGYTLFGVPAMLLVNVPLTMPTVPIKMADFVPIGRTFYHNFLILVNKDLPVNTLRDLITYAEKRPGTLSYGGATFGGAAHLIGELLKQTTQMDLQFIPFPGENPAITALLGNHIQVGIFTIFQGSHVKAKTVRALAVCSPKRDPLLPEVPTALEQGFPALALSAGYNVLLAPAKTPAPIVKKLETALEKTLQDKNVRDRLGKIELMVDFMNSQDTKAFLDSEVTKWSAVVKKAKIVIK